VDHAVRRLRLLRPSRLRSWWPAVMRSNLQQCLTNWLENGPEVRRSRQSDSSCLPPPSATPKTTPQASGESLACTVRGGGGACGVTAAWGGGCSKKSGSASVVQRQRFFKASGAAALVCRGEIADGADWEGRRGW